MIKAYLRKRLGDFVLDSRLEDSGIIAIVGRNGSGKTTFLKLISGILKPDFGYVILNNKDITNLPIEKRDVIYLAYDTYIPNLDVDKHLLWGVKNKSIKITEEELKDIKESFGINYKGKIKDLSLGMKIRVMLATAILARPKLILADEVFSNLSERDQLLKNTISKLKKYGIELIYTTQIVDDAKYAEKIYRMEEGKLTIF